VIERKRFGRKEGMHKKIIEGRGKKKGGKRMMHCK